MVVIISQELMFFYEPQLSQVRGTPITKSHDDANGRVEGKIYVVILHVNRCILDLRVQVSALRSLLGFSLQTSITRKTASEKRSFCVSCLFVCLRSSETSPLRPPVTSTRDPIPHLTEVTKYHQGEQMITRITKTIRYEYKGWYQGGVFLYLCRTHR